MRQTYENDYLRQNQRYAGLVALAAGVLQLVLLVPDLLLIGHFPGKMIVLLLRTVTYVLLLGFAILCLRRAIQSFLVFSWLVSIFEVTAIFFFLTVFHQYDPPHFIIQAMGMIILVMIVFFVPNRWLHMLVISCGGVAAFVLSAWLKMGSQLSANEFWAGLFYLSAAIGLCALVSYTLDKHRYQEFLAKSELILRNTIDPLTHASNRTKLIDAFSDWSSYCQRYRQPLSLALFDIDHFKPINDAHGHQKADQVLIDLVGLIREQLRKTDMIARWGGDEFVILFPGVDPDRAVQVLRRIRQCLHDQKLAESIPVTCSFGLARWTEGTELDALVREADMLMYQAKRAGGDGICRHWEKHDVI